VISPNGNPADGQASRVLGWTGTFDFTGEYTIQLSPVEGVEQSNYSLAVSLSESDDSEAPEAPSEPEEPAEPDTPVEPEEPAEPEAPAESTEPDIVSEQRVRFPSGQDSILVANSAGPLRVRRYVINLREGEVLEVEVENSTAPTTFSVQLPTGDPLVNSVTLWEDSVPVGGDYAVDVIATEDSEFTLRFGVQ
ncbi:MAG: serine/threonine protein kinase, partial [Cyanobacteria bacterium P01_H01_bin.153]